MGKVIFRLPSKGVQYGYAEYSYDDDGDAYQIGVRYRQFVMDFIKGEADGQKAERTPKYDKPITPTQVVASLPEDAEDDVMDVAVDLLVKGLGASVYDEPIEEEAPAWEAPPPAPSADDWEF